MPRPCVVCIEAPTDFQWERITHLHKSCYLHPKDCRDALGHNTTTPELRSFLRRFEDFVFLPNRPFGSDDDVIPLH